jgi:hypothetical protein
MQAPGRIQDQLCVKAGTRPGDSSGHPLKQFLREPAAE